MAAIELKIIQCYSTSDGQTFGTQVEAEYNQRVINLASYLSGNADLTENLHGDISTESVAQAIFLHWNSLKTIMEAPVVLK